MLEKKGLAAQEKQQKAKLQTAGKSDDKGVIQEFSRLSMTSNHQSDGRNSILQADQPQDGKVPRQVAY